MKKGLLRRALPAAAAAGAVALLTTLILAAGASPADAFSSLLRGAVGSGVALGETLTRATPILLCASGAVLAFRAGVLNIGLDGQFLMGAAAAAALGPLLLVPWPARLAAVAGATLAGALWAAPAAWLAERRRVPEVLTTILLNLVAAATVTWLVRGPLQDPTADFPQSRPLAAGVRFAPLVAGVPTTAAFPLALLLAAATGLFLARTPAGLKVRAVGASLAAARAIGLPVVPLRTGALLGSAALAGLAGGLEVVAVTGRLYDPFGSGVGYLGIAAALLGGTGAGGAAVSSLFFAALGTGGSALQRDTGVPASVASLVPGLLVLALLLLERRLEGETR
ncbi:MAG: ABC transporter permease subunit [Acidithiobacillales bacterium]